MSEEVSTTQPEGEALIEDQLGLSFRGEIERRGLLVCLTSFSFSKMLFIYNAMH